MTDLVKIAEQFADIWECEIDHPKFQDTVGDIVKKVIYMMEQENERLKEQPEIVMCKDCRWNSGYGRGMYFCFCTCYKTGTPHKDDWFCADAERRDGDGE